MVNYGRHLLLFAFTLSFCLKIYADTKPMPHNICPAPPQKDEASVSLVHKGQLWRKGRPIDLGELEQKQGEIDIPWSGDSYLILNPASHTINTVSGNSLIVKLTEVPAICKKTRQYKIGWVLSPKNFGHGKFEEQFHLDVDGPTSHGYPPVIEFGFDTNIGGFIHGASSSIEIDPIAAKEFFIGRRGSLIFHIKNVGDRPLRLRNPAPDVERNPKGIRVKRTDCDQQAIAASSSCLIELEHLLRPANFRTTVSYTLFFETNDIGAGLAEVHLKYDEQSDIRSYIKLW